MKRFVFALIILLISSCDDLRKQEVPDLDQQLKQAVPRKIEFEDTQIEDYIREYINYNNLKATSSYIVIELDGAMRKILSITSSNSAFYESSRVPSHYTLLDGFVVLLYSDIDYLNRSSSRADLRFYKSLFERQKVNLDSLEMLTHPPVWNLIRCNEGGFKLYKNGFGDKLYGLPCGYVLKRNDRDSIWVEKSDSSP